MFSDLISTYRAFYLLDRLSPTGEYTVTDVVPSGQSVVDFVEIANVDNVLVAAWRDPIQYLPYQNILVSDGVSEQTINLSCVERAIDIYSRPPSADIGTFLFMDSVPVPSQDWRCDRGMFGGMLFSVPDIPYSEAVEIKHYEVLLPYNGVAQIAYSESKEKQPLSDYLVDADEVPTTTRTLAELLRLVYEWSEVHKEPFNNTDTVSQKANSFVENMRLSDEEKLLIQNQTPMQVSNYLSGSTTARQRPTGTSPTTDEFMKLLFRRMACSSLSALSQLHGLPWNTAELVALERQELFDGVSRFKDFYNIDSSVDLLDEDNWETAIASSRFGAGAGPFMSNQLRNFKNKKTVLDMVVAGRFE